VGHLLGRNNVFSFLLIKRIAMLGLSSDSLFGSVAKFSPLLEIHRPTLLFGSNIWSLKLAGQILVPVYDKLMVRLQKQTKFNGGLK
jgi:hypothetical protein